MTLILKQLTARVDLRQLKGCHPDTSRKKTGGKKISTYIIRVILSRMDSFAYPAL